MKNRGKLRFAIILFSMIILSPRISLHAQSEGNWQQLPGLAVDIGVGADGSVLVIGKNQVPGGYGIFQWTGPNWKMIDGGAVEVSAGPDGTVWVVNSNGNIYKRSFL